MSADLGRWGRPERLVFLPVLGALIAVWVLTATLTLAERRIELERAAGQLTTTVVTLADFNELAAAAEDDGVFVGGGAQRTAAIWRALLRYPTASIWVETNGLPTDGQPPDGDFATAIVVREDRDGFSVLASMPQADALAGWWESVWQRGAVLLVASIAFLLLTRTLTRAMRQRAIAEQQAVAAEERLTQLAIHQTELEATVATRTSELRESNELLGRELVERKAAEKQLKEHDALLHSVAKSAAELLGSPSHEEAITAVLEVMGKTIGVSRAHLSEIATDRDGHLRSAVRYEWCAPGMTPVIDHAPLQNLDVTAALPRTVALLPVGGLSTFFVDELPDNYRAMFEQIEMRSFLQIAVLVEGKLWGSVDFIDSGSVKREWSWAETDTLRTLAGLIGAAITRARYVKELADANMIVQNSPTILYRVRGEPPFPLIYVSHNIRKFGHRADELLGLPDWAEKLMGPEDERRLAAAMARTLEKGAAGASIELRLRTSDGGDRWVENRYTPVRDRQGRLIEIEGMIIDITERKAAEDKIALLARTDSLTGLANRATFNERIRQAFAAAQRGTAPFAVLYLDLDHFKTINDTLGHPTGDQLLREVAERLRRSTREQDLVARLGGDEFAILQADVLEAANAGSLAATIQSSLCRPYLIGGHDLQVSVSIGISPYTPTAANADEMLAQADRALYRSKDEGRNRYRFHSDDLDDQVRERVTLAEELRAAIDGHELELYYQPQVELASGRIVGMEALIRWHHPVRGLLPASAFIETAEKTGAIVPLGQWVLDQACAQMRGWRDEGLQLHAVTMNLSLPQLKNSRELLNDVSAAIDKWRLAPSDLSFDVTEATLAQITLMRNDVLAALRRIGVGVAIDDFGSEYSSLDYLRTYRVSHLKVSQTLIDGAEHDVDRAATMRAILGLARELGIEVVTARVETAAQRGRSTETSTIAQGLFFSGAIAASDAGELLRRGKIDSWDAADELLQSALLERRHGATNDSGAPPAAPDAGGNRKRAHK
jgi:diguanylate cyclase (GGDEF)-like protein/PAS domain S-box-containing protein